VQKDSIIILVTHLHGVEPSFQNHDVTSDDDALWSSGLTGVQLMLSVCSLEHAAMK
jgi:hypothetical protein